jgi:formate dehydrogenase subunit gamma
LSKNLHNFVAPLFIVSVIAMVVLFVRHNLPKSYDFQFLVNAWNVMARGKHVPSGKFNAGEKLWFWGGVVVLSVIVTWSGLILLFPNFDQTRAVMQEAWIWHACAALLYVSISFGHIYLGTIGLEGLLPGDAQRLRRRGLGQGAPRDLVQRDEVRSSRRRLRSGSGGAPHREERG